MTVPPLTLKRAIGGAMSLSVSYMGTKRHLAASVAGLAADCRSGPLLDAFSGMCAIGRAIAPKRQVWSNDLQVFAYQVAMAHFCQQTYSLNAEYIERLVHEDYQNSLARCRCAFGTKLNAEAELVAARDTQAASEQFDVSIAHAQNIGEAHLCLPPYSLFSTRFAGNYFGYAQAAQADSIHAALSSLRLAKSITADQLRWALIALCSALSRVSTTTGHFAQPLRPKPSNAAKFFAQRARSVYEEWLRCLPQLKAYGSWAWREANYAFQLDAIDLLDDLRSSKVKPAVVYADPPYTRDQYSRYYHLLETAYLYDFPDCEGTGLYRGDRPTSSFSQKSRVEEALDGLVKATRILNADLILSYPEDGLLPASTRIIPQIIKSHYGHLPHIVEIEHEHSTMGASKGSNKHAVREILYKVSV